jgi:hypothetical protein
VEVGADLAIQTKNGENVLHLLGLHGGPMQSCLAVVELAQEAERNGRPGLLKAMIKAQAKIGEPILRSVCGWVTRSHGRTHLILPLTPERQARALPSPIPHLPPPPASCTTPG